MKKAVFITGGSRGIGSAIVEKFAKSGYSVAFTYLKSEEKAKAIAEKYDAIAICADVSKSDEMKNAIEYATSKFGKIDVLVNNAGIDSFSLFTDITDETWDEMIGVNLSGAFYACRAVLPQMISRKSGAIINISSMWGEIGASCEVHYSVAKAGIIGLTKALAKEVGLSGVRVNCVSPGVIDTDMNAHLSKEDMEELKSDTPLCKIGTACDVANAVYFLASDEASFITGQILGVNGGMVI